MPLTGKYLLNRFAELEGSSFANWMEVQIAQRVGLINLALRWACKGNQRLTALPFMVLSNASVAVTDGKIDLADLGDGWCSLWTSDPRPAGARQCPVDAEVSYDGIYPVDRLTSVFAFYRASTPQLVYQAGSDYLTPSNIPEELGDLVPLRALMQLFVSLEQWDGVNALKTTYGEPGKLLDSLVSALLQSGMVWQDNQLAFTPSSGGDAFPLPSGIVVTDTYIAVALPGGGTGYAQLFNAPP